MVWVLAILVLGEPDEPGATGSPREAGEVMVQSECLRVLRYDADFERSQPRRMALFALVG